MLARGFLGHRQKEVNSVAENDVVSDLIRKLFAAFLARDRKALEDLLSDDFRFNSPRDNHIDKAAYFERCFPYANEFSSHHIEQLCVDGNAAFVRYLAETRDGSRFRNTEYIRTDGRQVTEVNVYFGGSVTEQ
jgi:ketosteroid isomerase-like protein